MLFLFEILEKEFRKETIANVAIPLHITNNLNSMFPIRPYQKEAFQRFLLCYKEDFPGKPQKPLHLLYNMATGSGKTLVMAGLILHLYHLGYRNFLFFVNSNNIIRKTKDNFLNPESIKYLFNDKIFIDGKEIFLKEVKNFEESDEENINIKFTTIQQLHFDLNNPKENSITYEDFENQKFVLIADEAHHLNTGTKSGKLTGSWENTVLTIHKSNPDNILLEFTATLDYESKQILDKYKEKVLFKYDLSEFRKDKYSKEIELIRSNYEEENRILQALILNLYRQILAASYNINLKPIILFKAKRTIAESEQNKLKFHGLIDALKPSQIEFIFNTSNLPIIHKAYSFFQTKGISTEDIIKLIQFYFKPENCLSANNDMEAEKNQILLNTLEDENNPIRAVFAVQKLNEGWDVLNLFDIVRLYEGWDGNKKKPGKTTIAEAQLIGRGARYYPFSLEPTLISSVYDKYTRKFDDDPSHDLRILEEMYYHTKEDSQYILELKKALVDTGIYEEKKSIRSTSSIQIKETQLPNFLKSNRNGDFQFINSKRISFHELKIFKNPFPYRLPSGEERVYNLFSEKESLFSNDENLERLSLKIKDIPQHVVRYALTQNPFFYFNNLSHYFSNLESLSNFIQNPNYLAELEITFIGTKTRLNQMSNEDYLKALQGLLQVIQWELNLKSDNSS